MSSKRFLQSMTGYTFQAVEGVDTVSGNEVQQNIEGSGCVIILEGDPKGVYVRFNKRTSNRIGPIRGAYIYGIPFKEIFVSWTGTQNANIYIFAQDHGPFNLGPIDLIKDWHFEKYLNQAAGAAPVNAPSAELDADKVTVQIRNTGGANPLTYSILSTIDDEPGGIYTIDVAPVPLNPLTSVTHLIDHAVRRVQVEHSSAVGTTLDILIWAHTRR